jgi:hypothetical protein
MAQMAMSRDISPFVRFAITGSLPLCPSVLSATAPAGSRLTSIMYVESSVVNAGALTFHRA